MDRCCDNDVPLKRDSLCDGGETEPPGLEENVSSLEKEVATLIDSL
jgi:hypothetical protein